MVGLARIIYNPRPGEQAEELREPKELCDPVLTDRKAVESLLFDAFITAAYRDDATNCGKPQESKGWFIFLARHLERNIATPDLAWWQLCRAVPRTAFILTALLGATPLLALAFGLGSNQPETGSSLAKGLRYGLVIGVCIALVLCSQYGSCPFSFTCYATCPRLYLEIQEHLHVV